MLNVDISKRPVTPALIRERWQGASRDYGVVYVTNVCHQ